MLSAQMTCSPRLRRHKSLLLNSCIRTAEGGANKLFYSFCIVTEYYKIFDKFQALSLFYSYLAV